MVDGHTGNLLGIYNDKRIQALQSLRVVLEEHVEASTSLTEAEALASVLKTFLKSNNSHVSTATLPILPLYFNVLIPSSPSSTSTTVAHQLKHALSTLLPGMLEKLGDAKAPTREQAREGLVSAARANLRLGIQASTKEREAPLWSLIENGLSDHGFHSKNAKAREQAIDIRIPSSSSPNCPLPPLRPFTPLLLPLLADSDPSVRATALSTTISIFSATSVNTAAKTDLKKAMAKLDLPKKVQDQVIQSVLGGGGGGGIALERSPSESSSANSTTGGVGGTESVTAPSGPATRTRTRAALSSTNSNGSSQTNTSTPSLLSSLPAAAFPSDPSSVHAPALNSVEPVYLASIEDLRSQIDKMRPCFEGKETEHNWIERDKSISILRGMIEGGICKEDEESGGEMRDEFVRCIREIQDGIIKTSSSLRTTLANSTFALLDSLCTSLPPHLVDTLLDSFLPHCLSMASQTKKIVASTSQQTVTSFLSHSNYHRKTTQLLLSGMSDKVVAARQYVSSHLITFLKTHSGSQKVIEKMNQSGGTDDLEQAIKKGLVDPNAGVRENSRKAYWEFWRVWTARAEGNIREGLDSQAKKLLDKVKPIEGNDVTGGGESKQSSSTSNGTSQRSRIGGVAAATRGGATSGGPRSAQTAAGSGGGSAKKPSMRELMLAAKKKKLAEEAEANSQQEELLDTIATPSKPPAATPDPLTPQPRPAKAISASSSHDSLSQQARDSEAADNSQLLQDVQSPFEAPTSLENSQPYETPSRPSATSTTKPLASSSRRTSARDPATPINLPILEPVVDESLRDQAMQAEQTAERLLEIAQEEEEESSSGTTSHRAITPRPFEKSTNLQQQTPLNGGKLLCGRKSGGNDVFQDSPDPRDGTGGGGKGSWWMKKAENLEVSSSSLPADSEARTEEINSLISSLQSLEIDTADLKKLSALSRERPVREVDVEMEGKGRASAADWWRQGRRFEKVYEGLRKQLLSSEGTRKNSRDMALIVLRDLVENQFPCFSGDEAGVFELILKLREDPSRMTIAATEAIANSFTSRVEPLYGLGTLCPSLGTYLATTSAPSDATSRSFALGLKLIGSFFEGLPAEVLEDVFGQAKELIKKALNDQSSGDLRRAAINALVSAQSVLRDEKRLTEMMDGLASDQANLLTYYCAKRGL
ncbi:hypothetical protein JCM3765_001239 [Sporobolomyces pararoseus]